MEFNTGQQARLAPAPAPVQAPDPEWPDRARNLPYGFRLFGRFECRNNVGEWPQLRSRKLQEIMAYLLLYRDRPHQRENLAAALWPDSTTKQARRNLRQSLWQLQRVQSEVAGRAVPMMIADTEWLQIDRARVWLDVDDSEAAYARVGLLPIESMTEADAAYAAEAVELFRGSLLEGWDTPWVAVERQRLQGIHVTLLERLVAFCEFHDRVDLGLAYGNRLLRHDRANERAHWRLMRLHQMSGNRTAALRQFEKCREALQEELGITPGQMTTGLYERICSSG